MKTKIINLSQGWWRLVTELDGEQIVLMEISSFNRNSHYLIADFRYSTKYSKPSKYFEGHIRFESISFDEITEEQRTQFFNFNYGINEENRTYEWSHTPCLVMQGCDRPYVEQTEILRSEFHVWSYRAARAKMREAQEYWKTFEGTDWSSAKLENPNKTYTSREIISLIKAEVNQRQPLINN